jgi:hypothetical protein
LQEEKIVRIYKINFYSAGLALLLLAPSIWAQTTAFTYQGKLTEAGNPATGTYEMQFKLFDTPTPGTGLQQGPTILNPSVQVAAGSFTVQLDFGANIFDGTARYLEIAVRPAGNPNPHTILAPRQPITSSPYAVQTLNATKLGGLDASRYISSDVNGNVGIGTPTPQSKLTVQTSNFNFGFSHTNGTVTFGSYVEPTAGWFGTVTAHPLYFYTNSVFRMAITDSGNVGIGTSSPSQLLHIYNLSGNAATLVQTPANSFAQYRLQSGASNPWIIGTQDNFASNGLLFRNGVTDLMAIQPGGQVGIGTTSPQSKLAVLSSAHGITQTDGTVTVGTYIDSTGGWLGTRSNHPLHFFTGNSLQQMTLSTSGALGIGTTNPIFGRVHVRATDVDGVYASSNFHGIKGDSDGDGRAGLRGDGSGSSGFGVYGVATGGGNSTGVFGESLSNQGFGVFARSPNHGVWARTTGSGRAVYGDNSGSDSVGYAGYFFGRVNVTGSLTKGGGAFKIDHPLDPENKYLYHSFVESPDMMNIYNGVITLDASGEAVVELPKWFEALNRDFRYQLTCIGGFAPVYIAEKMKENRFKIAGGSAGLEVSWQVTGIRKDAYANAHRLPVEEDKPAKERGSYLHPETFGKPEELGVEWKLNPEMMKQSKADREKLRRQRAGEMEATEEKAASLGSPTQPAKQP